MWKTRFRTYFFHACFFCRVSYFGFSAWFWLDYGKFSFGVQLKINLPYIFRLYFLYLHGCLVNLYRIHGFPFKLSTKFHFSLIFIFLHTKFLLSNFSHFIALNFFNSENSFNVKFNFKTLEFPFIQFTTQYLCFFLDFNIFYQFFLYFKNLINKHTSVTFKS